MYLDWTKRAEDNVQRIRLTSWERYVQGRVVSSIHGIDAQTISQILNENLFGVSSILPYQSINQYIDGK